MIDEPRDGAEHGRDDPVDDPAADRPGPVDQATVNSNDPSTEVSAPWERPRRWSHQSGRSATRVDELLARLGASDDEPADSRRSRRRSSAAADDAVPAGELIAALTTEEVEPPGPETMQDADPAQDDRPAHDMRADPPDDENTVIVAAGVTADGVRADGVAADGVATDGVATDGVAADGVAQTAGTAGTTESITVPAAAAPRTPPEDVSTAPEDVTVVLAPGWGDATAGDSEKTLVLPSRIGPQEHAPIRDLGGDEPRTDFIPRLTGNAAGRAEADSIRAALGRQSRERGSPSPAGEAAGEAAGAAAGEAAGAVAGAMGSEVAVHPAGEIGGPEGHSPAGGHPPPHGGTHIVHGSGEPPRRHRGWLYAGRSVAALVAIITLLGVGVEWKIKDRADVVLQHNQVAALDTTDPSISTARTVPTVVTNSSGIKTTESVKAPTTYEPENILLLGSDTRAGGNAAIGGSDSSTADSAQSDTIMIAHISGDRQHVTILSIPRDTLVPAPTCKAWDPNTGVVSSANFPVSAGQTFHINNAYAVGGPKCTVTALQGLTGLGITRMIGIDFSGFEAMVNALGGVTVDICKPIVDTVLGTVAAKGGSQVIQGKQAISLVRARDVIGDTESDIARIHRQQVVLSAILRQVTQAGTLLNPAKLNRFLQAFTKNTFTANVTLEDLAALAGSLGTLDPAHVTFYTLPTVPSTSVDGALDVDRSKAPAIFDDLVNDLPLPGEVPSTTARAITTPATPAPTANSLRLTVAPPKVSLEIYNVSGQSNVATTTQQKLNAIGFKVGNDQLFKPDGAAQTGTTVLYAPGNRAAALTLAAAVSGSTLVITPGLGSTVRLMLGSGYGGNIKPVTVGALAPLSLAAAPSTGPSINTTSSLGTSAGSTALSSVNAGAGTCA